MQKPEPSKKPKMEKPKMEKPKPKVKTLDMSGDDHKAKYHKQVQRPSVTVCVEHTDNPSAEMERT